MGAAAKAAQYGAAEQRQIGRLEDPALKPQRNVFAFQSPNAGENAHDGDNIFTFPVCDDGLFNHAGARSPHIWHPAATTILPISASVLPKKF